MPAGVVVSPPMTDPDHGGEYVPVELAGKAHLGRAKGGGVRCGIVAARTG